MPGCAERWIKPVFTISCSRMMYSIVIVNEKSYFNPDIETARVSYFKLNSETFVFSRQTCRDRHRTLSVQKRSNDFFRLNQKLGFNVEPHFMG